MATSPRQQALANLSALVPESNARLARQRQQAQRIQMKQQISGARPDALNMNVAGQAGAQAQQAEQQAALGAAQATVEQQGRIAQMQTGETRIEGMQQIADKEELINKASIHLSNKLNGIDQRAKQRVYDERMAFSAAEAERGYLQQRQLADFAVLSAKSRNQYLDSAQKVEQWNRKQLQIMEALHKSLLTDLKGMESLKDQGLDQAYRIRAEKLVAAYERRIQREQARASNNRSMWTAGGAIVGGVLAGVFGTPAAAPAGAAAGAAVGGAIGGATA